MTDNTKRSFLLIILISLCQASTARGDGPELAPRSVELFGEVLEWSLENPSWSGNPFDLEARARFTHESGKAVCTTELFYAGDRTWRLRFMPTLPGRWEFQVSSEDDDLSKTRGSVTVTPTTATRRGFVVPAGRKWGIQQARGREVSIEAFLPQLVMYRQSPKTFASEEVVDRDIARLIEAHGFTGFHVPSIAGYWFDYDAKDDKVRPEMQNPDPQTFDALETLIRRTHAAGGMVHIWAWGDRSRRQTSDSLKGGQRGLVARRLERYIAARLGPLPGWTMGYGYDLDEWTKAETLEQWARNINDHSGWDHLMGGRPVGPNHGLDHSEDAKWNRKLSYASYEHHRPEYKTYVAAMEAPDSGPKPVFSEDRFRIRSQGRWKDYSAEDTRRGLWRSTMAGGVANIWGNLASPGLEDHSSGSAAYTNREQIQTWSQFWVRKDRFTLGLKRGNRLAKDPAVALADKDARTVIVYSEETDRIGLALEGDWEVQAVDTTQAYREIDLGSLGEDKSISLPRKSDWALLLKRK